MDHCTGRHYQYVEGFAVMPVLVGAAVGVKSLEFNVSAAQLAALPLKASDSSGLPVRLFSRGTYRWRLRCLTQRGQNSDKVDLANWAVAQNSWPAECYVHINNQPIQLGRKQHFKRDLPVELTDYLKGGKNEVKVSVPNSKKNVAGGAHYYFAVECVATKHREDVLQSVTTRQTVEAAQTKDAIAKRLEAVQNDEDVAFASNDLTISLADPFSSVLFTMPVRGKSCKHLECFDLHHWLDTRSGKKTFGRVSPEEPSAVDEWKCPICGADARPPVLIVDLFLKGIRDSLVEAGRSTVKSVRVAADGTWTAVDEPDDIDTDDQGDQDEKLSAAKKAGNQHEVIEILDDD
jgi:MIZ/SP-RING zinc finger